MKFLISTFFIAVSLQVSAKEEAYKCDFAWKTLSENISIMDRPVTKSLTQKISENITAAVTSTANSSSISVIEYYKDNRKNFIEYQFSCSRNFNCSGFKKSVVDGKKENQSLTIPPTANFASGKIESRELFQYKNQQKGFFYNYIIYKNEADQPMGLAVTCRK